MKLVLLVGALFLPSCVSPQQSYVLELTNRCHYISIERDTTKLKCTTLRKVRKGIKND